ncbi:MAG: general secretion pathway protein GspK [Kiritimatiellae bacterium]|nr:general secretion pathway protein GspK [Kiritimatiellia bacterium]
MALVIVLWMVVILSLIVASFAFDMHVEARITSFYRKKLKADYLARAGVERARMLLCKSARKKTLDEEEEEDVFEWHMFSERLRNGMRVDEQVEFEEGRVDLSIVPEPALRNVNYLKKEDWQDLFYVSNVPEGIWDELIDCFFDWTDPDVFHRLNGAETDDWYSKLDPPYQAKNGPLDTIDELKLIKGFSTEVLYGGLPEDAAEGTEPMKGILQWLTTFGDGKLNVNAASFDVLMTLPFVDATDVEEIIAARGGEDGVEGTEDDEHFKNVDDLLARVPGLDAALKNYMTTDSQRTFRVTSVARIGADPIYGLERGVQCILSLEGETNLTVLSWQEEL